MTFFGKRAQLGIVLGACVTISAIGGLRYASAAGEGRSTSRSDASATTRYLRAQRIYALTTAGSVGQVKAAQNHLAARVTQMCRGALRGAPTDAMTKEFVREILGALALAAQKVTSSSADRFAQEVSTLHWTDPRLATMIATLVSARERRREMQLPHLCSDARYWAAGHFAKLAPDTLRFNRRYYGAVLVFQTGEGRSTLDAAIANRLSKYETARQRAEQHQLKPPNDTGDSTPPWIVLIESLGTSR